MTDQLQHQLIALAQRTNTDRRTGEDHVARLQGKVPGHVLDHADDGVEHVAAVAVLAGFTVDHQANADIGQVLDGIAGHEGCQHAGAVETLGDFPGIALLLEPGLHVAQGQVQRRRETADGVTHFFGIRLFRQWLADQHGDFRLVMHRAAILGDDKATL